MATESQRSLLDEQEPDKLDTMLVEHEEAIVPEVMDDPPERHPATGPLADLRAASQLIPADKLLIALEEADERETIWRTWLLSKLISGVDYGYPPGTEPKYNDQGEQLVWSKGGMKVLPREQWTLKPSLYESGSDKICYLMGVRPLVNADHDLWVQAGSMAGHLCFRCQIISKATGEVIGEGHGGAKIQSNSKTDPLNQAIMMGRKRAKVKAVRDAYALADLFTQDLEDVDHGPANHPAPQANPDAKKDQPRKKRVTAGQFNDLKKSWLAEQGDVSDDKEALLGAFHTWCEKTLQRDFDVTNFREWTVFELGECSKALGIPND